MVPSVERVTSALQPLHPYSLYARTRKLCAVPGASEAKMSCVTWPVTFSEVVESIITSEAVTGLPWSSGMSQATLICVVTSKPKRRIPIRGVPGVSGRAAVST